MFAFYEHNIFVQKSHFSKPKSAYRHGLCVLFSECDPFLVKEIAELARNSFPNHTAAHSRLDKGYFEFAFKTAIEADAAAKFALQIGERFVPTIRTHYARDTNVLIRFEELPCTLHRSDLLVLLDNGLCQYGQVIELQLNKDPLFPESSNSRGYAIIEPLPGVAEDINLIPCVAHFVLKGLQSPPFCVIPEKAPTVCTSCKNLGHNNNACPEDLLKLLKKKSEDGTESEPEIDDSYDDHGSAMGSVVDSDEFLETFEETTDTTESYEWGETASYKLVKPTTKEQRRQAHIKAQENLQEPSSISENVPQPSAETSNNSHAQPAPNLAPLNNPSVAETVQSSNLNSNPTQPDFTPIVNPFGDVPFVTVCNPRGAGRKPKVSRGRPGAGRPKKSVVNSDPQPSIISENLFNHLPDQNANPPSSGSANQSVYTQTSENNQQAEAPFQQDPGHASRQYSTEEVFYEPSQENFVNTMERHPHNEDGLSQY